MPDSRQGNFPQFDNEFDRYVAAALPGWLETCPRKPRHGGEPVGYVSGAIPEPCNRRARNARGPRLTGTRHVPCVAGGGAPAAKPQRGATEAVVVNLIQTLVREYVPDGDSHSTKEDHR